MTFDVSIERGTSGLAVVRVLGEVDLDTSPRLLGNLQDALRGGAGVVVDLAGVGYIDSSGVATLIQGLKLAGKTKARFALRDPSPRVRGVLELSRLTDLFEIEGAGGPTGG
ncbi:MAG: STAS domain-containing protein [Planctomycetota bacterium]